LQNASRSASPPVTSQPDGSYEPKEPVTKKLFRVVDGRPEAVTVEEPDPFRLGRGYRSLRTLTRFANIGASALGWITVVLVFKRKTVPTPIPPDAVRQELLGVYILLLCTFLFMYEISQAFSNYPYLSASSCYDTFLLCSARYCTCLFNPYGKAFYLSCIGGLLTGIGTSGTVFWIYWLQLLAILYFWVLAVAMASTHMMNPRALRAMDVRQQMPRVTALYIQSMRPDRTQELTDELLGSLSSTLLRKLRSSREKRQRVVQKDNWLSTPSKIGKYSRDNLVTDVQSWYTTQSSSNMTRSKKETKTMQQKRRVEGNMKP